MKIRGKPRENGDRKAEGADFGLEYPTGVPANTPWDTEIPSSSCWSDVSCRKRGAGGEDGCFPHWRAWGICRNKREEFRKSNKCHFSCSSWEGDPALCRATKGSFPKFSWGKAWKPFRECPDYYLREKSTPQRSFAGLFSFLSSPLSKPHSPGQRAKLINVFVFAWKSSDILPSLEKKKSGFPKPLWSLCLSGQGSREKSLVWEKMTERFYGHGGPLCVRFQLKRVCLGGSWSPGVGIYPGIDGQKSMGRNPSSNNLN